MDIRLALMSGIDIPIPECQVIIHQPTIKEISYLGEEDFFSGIQCLCIDKNQLLQDNIPEEATNFEIFMVILSQPEAQQKKDCVKDVLLILFPDYKTIFTPRSILFKKDNETFIIDDKNFSSFQEMIKLIFCVSSKGNNQSFNPADAKAREIAQKLMRGRQRVAAQKGEANSSVLSQYVSVITVGISSMSIQDALNLTLYQLYDLVERYSLYTNWDIDIRSRLAGAKIEKPPENWMKNIH